MYELKSNQQPYQVLAARGAEERRCGAPEQRWLSVAPPTGPPHPAPAGCPSGASPPRRGARRARGTIHPLMTPHMPAPSGRARCARGARAPPPPRKKKVRARLDACAPAPRATAPRARPTRPRAASLRDHRATAHMSHAASRERGRWRGLGRRCRTHLPTVDAADGAAGAALVVRRQLGLLQGVAARLALEPHHRGARARTLGPTRRARWQHCRAGRDNASKWHCTSAPSAARPPRTLQRCGPRAEGSGDGLLTRANSPHLAAPQPSSSPAAAREGAETHLRRDASLVSLVKLAASLARSQVGETEGVRWKGYPCTLLHAAAFRAAKTP